MSLYLNHRLIKANRRSYAMFRGSRHRHSDCVTVKGRFQLFENRSEKSLSEKFPEKTKMSSYSFSYLTDKLSPRFSPKKNRRVSITHFAKGSCLPFLVFVQFPDRIPRSRKCTGVRFTFDHEENANRKSKADCERYKFI